MVLLDKYYMTHNLCGKDILVNVQSNLVNTDLFILYHWCRDRRLCFFQHYHACSVKKGDKTMKTQACPFGGACTMGPFAVDHNGTKMQATYCSGIALEKRPMKVSPVS